MRFFFLLPTTLIFLFSLFHSDSLASFYLFSFSLMVELFFCFKMLFPCSIRTLSWSFFFVDVYSSCVFFLLILEGTTCRTPPFFLFSQNAKQREKRRRKKGKVLFFFLCFLWTFLCKYNVKPRRVFISTILVCVYVCLCLN